MKSEKIYLQHILEMIERVEAIAGSGHEAFLNSLVHQDAALRNLHTLTGTTQRLSDELKAAHPEVEWASLAAFRNVLVHDYLGIDIDLVWTVVTRDIPELKNNVVNILKEFE